MKTQTIRFLSYGHLNAYIERYHGNKLIADAIADQYEEFHNTLSIVIEKYRWNSYSTSTFIRGIDRDIVSTSHLTPTELQMFTDFSEDRWHDHGLTNAEKKSENFSDDDDDTEDDSEEPGESFNELVDRAKAVVAKKVKVPPGVKMTTHVHINTTIASPKKALEMIKFLQQQFGV